MPGSMGKAIVSEQPQIEPKQGPAIPNQQQHSLLSLIQALKYPSSPQQKQQMLSILKSNPQLMAAFIKQKTAMVQQQQQQQLLNGGNPMGNAIVNEQPQIVREQGPAISNQQCVLSILKSNQQLMATSIKQRIVQKYAMMQQQRQQLLNEGDVILHPSQPNGPYRVQHLLALQRQQLMQQQANERSPIQQPPRAASVPVTHPASPATPQQTIQLSQEEQTVEANEVQLLQQSGSQSLQCSSLQIFSKLQLASLQQPKLASFQQQADQSLNQVYFLIIIVVLLLITWHFYKD